MTDAITVYSDYVCPFCYLGRASLDQYQSTRDERLDIDWHPFDLRARKRNPDGSIDDSVDDGKDEDYYEQAKQNVRRLQERYGVEMELDLSREVDSLPAQVASLHVREEYPYGTWLAFDEGVFDALWKGSRDIGDTEVLVDVAVDDDGLRARLHERFAAANETGITGVPTFVYDGHAARGAVPPEQLRRLVEGYD